MKLKNYNLAFIILLSLSTNLFAETCPRTDMSDFFAAGYFFDNAKTLAEPACEMTKRSKICQTFYKELAESMTREEIQGVALKCNQSNSDSFSWKENQLVSCAAGLVVDPIVDFGKFLGDTAAQATIAYNDRKVCDESLDRKLQMIEAFNINVPRLMKIQNISNEELKKKSCNQVQVMVISKQTEGFQNLKTIIERKEFSPSQKNNLTEDEKEFLAYRDRRVKGVAGSGGNPIFQLVENMKNELSVRMECYNPEARARLTCEIAGFAASVAVPPLMALRAARLAKLTGIKAEQFAAKFKGLTTSEGKFISEEEKLKFMSSAGKLSNEERIAAFEKLIGKNLSKEEKDQLIKMHNIGSERGFFEYNYEDLRNKLQAANQINPKTGKPFFTKEEAMTAMRSGITGTTSEGSYRVALERATKYPNNFSSQRILGEAAAGVPGKEKEAIAAFKKSYSLFVAEKKLPSDPKQAATSLKLFSERELSTLEELASASGQKDLLAAAVKERMTKVEAQITANYRKHNQPGASKAYSDYLSDYFNELKDQSMRNKNSSFKGLATDQMAELKKLYPNLR